MGLNPYTAKRGFHANIMPPLEAQKTIEIVPPQDIVFVPEKQQDTS
jgi:hypothetical protein